ncbi:MAG: RdgB/HAM1 family non-canonical purine NTP pyrophosphatase [Oscillospiraceae bacterium]|nr:RdgB/HAM1 family non-canonical purine NTP pyrophosphatase [Oscillospiraceae bacterium]
MRAVLASHNPGKLREMQRWLEPLGIDLVLESELGMDIEVEETGETFEENSLLKAATVARRTGLPAIADDSGLCVEALDGAPGVHTARYGGPGLTEKDRYMLLLMNMRGQLTRAAKFVSVVTMVFPNADVVSARGELKGAIAYAPIGDGGFGYDPVFLVTHMRKTLAQMDLHERELCSHRAAAIRNLTIKLEQYWKEKGRTEWN